MIIFAVVLYGIHPSASRTLQTLISSLKRATTGIGWNVLVLDNSAEAPSLASAESQEYQYHHFPENAGLAKTYNSALACCHDRGAKYLVTLDQDSTVTVAYLDALFGNLESLHGEVVALCPTVRSSGRIVSPFSLNLIGFPTYGATDRPLYAINSMSCYSVAYLESVGGFSDFYWLDGLDLVTFARIARDGNKVLLLDVEVSHQLSLAERIVSPQRFLNILYYEACYLFENESPLRWIGGMTRLTGRAILAKRYGVPVRHTPAALGKIVSGIAKGIRRRLEFKS